MDTEFPYGYEGLANHGKFTTAGTCGGFIVDSPGWPSLSTFKVLKIGGVCTANNQQCYERFVTYLMFKPANLSDSWVPLLYQGWNLQATARLDNTGLWGIDVGPQAVLEPASGTGVQTDVHPEWEINARNRNKIDITSPE